MHFENLKNLVKNLSTRTVSKQEERDAPAARRDILEWDPFDLEADKPHSKPEKTEGDEKLEFCLGDLDDGPDTLTDETPLLSDSRDQVEKSLSRVRSILDDGFEHMFAVGDLDPKTRTARDTNYDLDIPFAETHSEMDHNPDDLDDLNSLLASIAEEPDDFDDLNEILPEKLDETCEVVSLQNRINELEIALRHTQRSLFDTQAALSSERKKLSQIEEEKAFASRGSEEILQREKRGLFRLCATSDVFWPDSARNKCPYNWRYEAHKDSEVTRLRGAIEKRVEEIVSFSQIHGENELIEGSDEDPAVIARGLLQEALAALNPETQTEGSFPRALALRVREVGMRDTALLQYVRHVDRLLRESGNILREEVKNHDQGLPAAICAALLHYRELSTAFAPHVPELQVPVQTSAVHRALRQTGRSGLRADILSMAKVDILALNGVGPVSYQRLEEEMRSIGYEISPIHVFEKARQSKSNAGNEYMSLRDKVFSELGLPVEEFGPTVLDKVLEMLRKEMGADSSGNSTIDRINARRIAQEISWW